MSGDRRSGAPRRSRLSGIFVADEQVFRFHPDGLVLDVLIKPTATPEQGPEIARWLTRHHPPRGVHAAEYAIADGRISFRTRSHYRDVAVEVRGTWRAGRLVLGLREGGQLIPDRRFRLIWPAPADQPGREAPRSSERR